MGANHFVVMIAGMAKPGMEDYVERSLIHIMEHSRKDNGCLAYNIHVSQENPAEFMVYMVWTNREAFEAHNRKPDMIEFRKQLASQWFEQQSPKTYWHMLG